MRKKIFLVESRASSFCPVCGKPLAYRDSCLRILKKEGGECLRYLINRLRCTHCLVLHRELPDCMVPYKHYSAEVISGVLDGYVTSADEDAEDYPCEVTILRWHHWLIANTLRIDGYLKSIGYQVLGFTEELLKSGVSLLQELRSSHGEWFETILRFIYNSGGYLASV